MLETHRKLSNTDKYHELFIGMDANCKPKVVVSSSESNPSAKAAWFTAIGAWTQLTSAKSGTTMSFTIPTGCSEIMVAAVCTSTLTVSGASVRRYAGSVVVPFNRLDTTQTEWLLGGGSVGSTSSASGTRYCAVRLTKTSALGIGAHCDGTDYASSTTFYVYWR